MTDIRSGGIYWVQLDKIRPAVVLTRDVAVPYLSTITVAPIFTKVRGVKTEVIVDERNGLDHESAVNLDNVCYVHRVFGHGVRCLFGHGIHGVLGHF